MLLQGYGFAEIGGTLAHGLFHLIESFGVGNESTLRCGYQI